MVQIPLHRLGNAGLERFGRLPAEFTLDLARIDGIAAVMTGTIRHMRDLRAVALAIRTGTEPVKQIADDVHDIDIGLFVPAAHVVGFADLPGLQHAADGTAVVLDVEPVPNLHAVAIHRQRLASQRIHDHERNELFGEMVGPVIVAAVGGQHRQPISVVVCTHQMVACSLACAVGAVWLVAMPFGKRRSRGFQRAIHLVGRHMQQAESRLLGNPQSPEIRTHRLQQMEGADDIGLDEILRAMDRTIHMALCRKVHHRTRPMLGQQPLHQRTVADVPLHKDMAGIVLERSQRLQIARIGELVQIDHRLLMPSHPVQHKISADETGAACDENSHRFP